MGDCHADGACLATLLSVASVTWFVTFANFACTLVCQLTNRRHLHEKQRFEVVFHLMRNDEVKLFKNRVHHFLQNITLRFAAVGDFAFF